MAIVSVNTNIASLQAIRRLSESSAELSSSFERLSSGMRINRAADDAAGLAVSSALNVDSRLYSQALRNVNDGISYLNVADGATKELKGILFRLKELATQSSNGTFSTDQRQSLEKESQALQSEYNRILDTAEFNGVSVFQNQTLTLQAGIRSNSLLSVALGTGSVTVAAGDGTFAAARSLALGGASETISIADLNGDSKLDVVAGEGSTQTISIFFGNGDGTFGARLSSYSGGAALTELEVADVNGDGRPDLISRNYNEFNFSVLLGNGDGTFSIQSPVSVNGSSASLEVGDLNSDGWADLVTNGGNGPQIALGNGNGTFQAVYSVGFSSGNSKAVELSDLNDDGRLDIIFAENNDVSILLNNGDGTFGYDYALNGKNVRYMETGDFNGDGEKDLITAQFYSSEVLVLLGSGDGSFAAPITIPVGSSNSAFSRGSIGDFNGDSKLDAAITDFDDGTVSILLGNGNGTFQVRRTLAVSATPLDIAAGDLNGDGITDLVSDHQNASRINILLGNGSSTTSVQGLSNMSGISIATQSQARLAQDSLNSYVSQLNLISGVIGSSLSRLAVAAGLNRASADVLKTAESRITDVDVAAEAARLTSNQILQQVSASVLAQANQQPQIVLQLLGI